MDLTGKLPDEILIEIFSHLRSLRDKLRLESVNRRFQWCLHELLSIRPPHFSAGWRGELTLNGYVVPPDQFIGVVQSLANKAKFSSIDIFAESKQQLVFILAALLSADNTCLEKVTTVQLNRGTGCSETPLAQVLARCPKLSELPLDFLVGWSDSAEDMEPFPMDLSVVLKEKALTHLHISISYTFEQVVQLFQSIKPKTLKKLDLRLCSMTLDMGSLVTELCGEAWAALEEMQIHFDSVNLQMDALFSSLAHLPALCKCKFIFCDTKPHDQLGAALTSLFTNEIDIEVVFGYLHVHHHHETACQWRNAIRQAQAIHPDLQVDFGPNADKLTLTLGKVCFDFQHFLLGQSIQSCDDADCTGCGAFYPTLIDLLGTRANQRVSEAVQEVHLASGRLDRCRVGSVVAKLNEKLSSKAWVS